MISKPQGSRLSRWAAGALVMGTTTAVMAVPFAGTAIAAPAGTPATSVTAPTTSYTTSTNTPVHITGTYAPANSDANIQLTVTQGPDAVAGGAQVGANCAKPAPAGNFDCTFTPTHGLGTDTVRVYADNDNSNTNNAGDVQSAPITVNVVSGAVNRVQLSPDTQSTATGTCAAYTLAVTDANGKGVPNSTVSVSATAVQNTAGATLTECTPGNTTAGSPNALNFTVTTDNTGAATFSFKSDTAGSSTVTATDNGAQDVSTQTFTAGGTQNAKTVTVTPSTFSGYTGSTAHFQATVNNGTGQALQGITVNYVVTSGPDATTGFNNTCTGTTDASGHITCDIPNGGTAGTDNITFYVNQSGANSTPGPDAGEPQTTASATFAAAPTVNNVTVTCVDKTTAGGQAGSTCTVPVDQTSTTFTVKATNNTPNPNTPVSGVVVSLNITANGGPNPADVSPTATQCTTGADGTCTVTISEPKPQNNETITVTPAVGATSYAGGRATETFQTRVATNFTVTPVLQTVQNGGTVNVTAAETDQFGGAITAPQSLTYAVGAGNQNGLTCALARNNGKTGSATTGADGKASISYTDTTPVNPNAECDQVTVSNATSGQSATASVQYTAGSTAAASVALTGVNTTSTPNAIASQPVSATATHPVTATVTNSAGSTLAGVQVTFTVSQGFVGAAGVNSTTGTTTYTTTTNGNGVATANVGSTKTGTQTVTATAGTASASGTITYNNTAENPTALTLTPDTATIQPGSAQRFTASVVDQFGNGVQGQFVTFSQSGPGSIGATSTVTAATDANGQVTVTVSTLATDSGTGSVTATDGAIVDTTKRTDTSTYTVTANPPTTLTLSAASGTKAGGTEKVTATLTRQDGTPAASVVVRFTVTGANPASGSATTSSSGVATFSYSAAKAGTDTINAFADTNGDGAQQPTEPTGTTSASITSGKPHVTRENPTITAIHSGTRGHVTIHVTSHPKVVGASVHYYKISKSGHRHLLGKGRTGKAGKDAKQFKLTPGKTYKFQVRVYAAGRSDLTPGLSGRQTQRVHK